MNHLARKLEWALGEALFEKLAGQLGGVTIYLPENPRDEHPYLQVLSRREYSLVLDAIGPGRVTLPRLTGRRRRQMAELARKMRQDGETIQAIALHLEVHERTVYRMLRETGDG